MISARHGLGTRLYRTQPCSQGLSWVPMHVQAQAFSRLLQSSFQVNMALVCYLHLCSQWYILVHVEIVDALSQWRQHKQQRRLQHTTITKFLAIQPARYRVWHSENLLHWSTLWFTATTASVCLFFFVIIAMHACTCLNHKLQTMWARFLHSRAQSSRVYLMSTLDIMHVIKRNRLSPSERA